MGSKAQEQSREMTSRPGRASPTALRSGEMPPAGEPRPTEPEAAALGRLARMPRPAVATIRGPRPGEPPTAEPGRVQQHDPRPDRARPPPRRRLPGRRRRPRLRQQRRRPQPAADPRREVSGRRGGRRRRRLPVSRGAGADHGTTSRQSSRSFIGRGASRLATPPGSGSAIPTPIDAHGRRSLRRASGDGTVEILRGFADRAYRRPAAHEELDRLVGPGRVRFVGTGTTSSGPSSRR